MSRSSDRARTTTSTCGRAAPEAVAFADVCSIDYTVGSGGSTDGPQLQRRSRAELPAPRSTRPSGSTATPFRCQAGVEPDPRRGTRLVRLGADGRRTGFRRTAVPRAEPQAALVGRAGRRVHLLVPASGTRWLARKAAQAARLVLAALGVHAGLNPGPRCLQAAPGLRISSGQRPIYRRSRRPDARARAAPCLASAAHQMLTQVSSWMREWNSYDGRPSLGHGSAPGTACARTSTPRTGSTGGCCRTLRRWPATPSCTWRSSGGTGCPSPPRRSSSSGASSSSLQQLGAGEHGEPGDFSYRDQESLVALAKALARQPPAAGARPGAAGVAGADGHQPGLPVERPRDRQPPVGRCPFIEIEGTEEPRRSRACRRACAATSGGASEKGREDR